MKALVCTILMSIMCQTLVAQQTTPPGTIWFYRPATDSANFNPTLYKVSAADAQPLVQLAKGRFFSVSLAPGIYGFSWTRGPARGERILVSVESGQQNFVEVLARSLTAVSADRALANMRSGEPIERTSVRDPSVIVPQSVPEPAPVQLTQAAPESAELTSQDPQRIISSAPQSDLEIPGLERINAPRLLEISLVPYSYSRLRSVNFTGADVSIAVNVDNRTSIMVDGSRYEATAVAPIFGVAAASKGRIWTYRVGPKLSWRPNERMTLFGNSSIGGVRFEQTRLVFADGNFVRSSVRANGVSAAVGGGIDWGVNRWFAIRLMHGEYTYLQIADGSSHSTRIQAGIIFRIGRDFR